jgi:hypothetical protein
MMGEGITVGIDFAQRVVVMVLTWRPEEPDYRKPWPEVRHHVGWIERVAAAASLSELSERFGGVSETARNWGYPMIVFDATGVGQPVVESLKRCTTVPFRALAFTSGENEVAPQFDVERVPRIDVTQALEVVQQSGRLSIDQDCPVALDSSDTTALSLALWWGERPDPGAANHQAEVWRRQRAAW